MVALIQTILSGTYMSVPNLSAIQPIFLKIVPYWQPMDQFNYLDNQFPVATVAKIVS